MAMDEEKIAHSICVVLKAELENSGMFKSNSLSVSPVSNRGQILVIQRIKNQHHRLPIRIDVAYEHEEGPGLYLLLLDDRAVKAAKAWCKAGMVKYKDLVGYTQDEETPYLYLSHNTSICGSLIELQQSLWMFLTHLVSLLNEMRAEERKVAEKEAKEAKKRRA